MYLQRSIYSIDKKLLLAKGEGIDNRVLSRIVKDSPRIRYIGIKNTALIRDIKKEFDNPIYRIILADKEENRRILDLIKKTSIPDLLFKEIMLLKKKLRYTYKHMLVVTILATKLAIHKHLKDKFDALRVIRTGLAHDLGKSRIPLKILNKTSPLTKSEREIIKTHPLIGYLLLHYYYGKEHSKYDRASYEHHERLDGSGYPRKIKRLNKYAQLMSAIDTLDALVSKRPYRKTSYSLRAAIDFLLDEADSGKLNKKIVYVLISLARKDKPGIRGLKIGQKYRDKPPKDSVYGQTIPD